MSDYDNTNTGALFKNDQKATEKHPDYKGSLNVGGTEYWLSAWIKKSKAGATFMSLAVTPKEEKPKAGTQRAAAQPDEDLPF